MFTKERKMDKDLEKEGLKTFINKYFNLCIEI